MVKENGQVSIEALKDLGLRGGNEIILWRGHGSYVDKYGSVLCIGEYYDANRRTYDKAYDDEFNDVKYMYTEDGRLVITREFVDKYVHDLDGALVYLGACQSGRDSMMADAWIDAGAKTVIGFTDTVMTAYDGVITRDFVKALCTKDSRGRYLNAYDPRDEPDGGSVVKPSETGRGGYVLADSATHLYSREELAALDDWGLAVARNEIPARHGYRFEGGEFAQYFNSKSWYKGTLTREQFQSKVGILNYIEEANVQTILSIEVLNGSKYVPDSSQVISPSLTGPSGYVLPKSDSHLYTKAELGALTDWGLAVARNEINARHGYIFEPGRFADYFKSKTWYRGTLTGDEFRSKAGILNATEEANVATILEMEKEINSQYRPK